MVRTLSSLTFCCLVTACGGAGSKGHVPEPVTSTSATASTSKADAPSSATPVQLLPPELSALLGQLTADNPRLHEVAAQIAESANPVATRQASQRLIALATRIGSNDYRDQHRSEVKSLSERRGGGVLSEANLEVLLVSWQTEKLAPIVDAMDAYGSDDVLDFALREAEDRALAVDRRRVSVKLLQHRVLPSDTARTARVTPLVAEMERLSASQGTAHDAANDVQEVTQALTGEFRKCADKAMQKTPNLDVKGVLELKVGADGKVTNAEAREVAPKDLATCVEKAGRGARFHEPKTGKGFTLRLPIVFRTIPAANP